MTDLAAALLKDVPRYEPDNPPDNAPSMKADPQGDWLPRDAVLAALSAHLDPALTERAGEVLERLRKADEYEPLGHDGWEAADLITALLTANAALRAERDRYLRHLTTGAESLNAYKARAEAAEAEVEKLRGALQIARVHVANNAEGWSVSRGAARDDLTIVDAALTTEADNG